MKLMKTIAIETNFSVHVIREGSGSGSGDGDVDGKGTGGGEYKEIREKKQSKF